uniref:Uncharacterized protein n=1 Tax=Anguilla anguilla TaxID=7936 RepID=A0A0E9RU60_ANGAN
MSYALLMCSVLFMNFRSKLFLLCSLFCFDVKTSQKY